jgi:hypothetical protein
VEMHLPTSVSQAATLAEVHEHLTEKPKQSFKKYTTPKNDNKPPVNSTDLWKARQLKEYRRLNNLCYKCGDKYTPGHTCSTTSGSLHLLESVAFDGGAILSDEILTALESPQFNLLQDDCYLSLHALSGKLLAKAIQLRALVQN